MRQLFWELKRRNVYKVAVFGFPIAVVLAWAFEVTPERGEADGSD